MIAGSGLAAGQLATPALAERAVHRALEAAGLARAGAVILFLSRDFARQPQPAVLAAARAAGCLQVIGCTAGGLLTERGWLLDQSGAAALVIETPADPAPGAVPALSFSAGHNLPFEWQSGLPRSGLLEPGAALWNHGRPAGQGSEMPLPGPDCRLAISTGLRPLGETATIEIAEAYEIQQIAGLSAAEHLLRQLPPDLRERPALHRIVALRRPELPGIPILSINGDGTVTLAETLAAGEQIRWAVRQPLSAEQDMRQTLQRAAGDAPPPACALMFSCIGRGPLFYGDDDRDLAVFRERFPGTPLLGAYGHGQIAPVDGRNRLFHNSVITLMLGSSHV